MGVGEDVKVGMAVAVVVPRGVVVGDGTAVLSGCPVKRGRKTATTPATMRMVIPAPTNIQTRGW
jgi:hypothetical protein